MQNGTAPQNGIPGLKHWRYDLLAGLQVALVSLPLSLGIAIASGAPPVTGVISAIIAGLIFPFLGGAYVTISGPAAGLAPALLAGMLMLGDGDLSAGYPILLVAICITGFVQIVLSLFKAGKLVAMFLPVIVVEAMLAAIGLIIIIKQLPALLGVAASPAMNMFASLINLPAYILHLDPAVFLIGSICLFLMFFLNRTKYTWMRKVPAPLMVCGIGIFLGYAFNVDAKYLIVMPENIIEGGITFPAFSEVMDRPELWGTILVVVITLTLIDGIESLATISAVDKIDPFQRKSDPNTTLRAMGVSNTLSSIFGGLTIIPGGIKSRANIDAGGRTLWANFYNAIFLVIFLFFLKDVISLIPLAAIAAILIYVGWRLCEPSVFSKTFSIGRDQIIIFCATVIAILATDLLTGILLGVAAEILLLMYMLTPSARLVLNGRMTFSELTGQTWRNLIGLFRSPVIKLKKDSNSDTGHYTLSLSSLVGFNLLALDRDLAKVPENAGITFNVTESCRLIDHTSMEYLHQLQEECLQIKRPFEIHGMDKFHPHTEHPLAARMQDTRFVTEKARRSERELIMADVARNYGFEFTAKKIAALNPHDFVYLRRGSDREESNTMTGIYMGCKVRVFDYFHTASPDYYVEHRHTLALIYPPEDRLLALPNFAVTPGSYLERYLVKYEELDSNTLDNGYRVYSDKPDRLKPFLNSELRDLLQQHAGVYLEVRNNILLVFNPRHELIQAKNISDLLSFAILQTTWSNIRQDAASCD